MSLFYDIFYRIKNKGKDDFSLDFESDIFFLLKNERIEEFVSWSDICAIKAINVDSVVVDTSAIELQMACGKRIKITELYSNFQNLLENIVSRYPDVNLSEIESVFNSEPFSSNEKLIWKNNAARRLD